MRAQWPETPAGSPELERLVLAPTAASVRRARDFTHKRLADWGLEELLDDTVIVMSELLSNALTHALTRTSTTPALQLVLIRHPRSLVVVVTDPASAPPLPVVQPDEFATSGRGLHIVDTLSSRWGWVPLSTRGKAVWAVLDEM
ncbi:ATP-binding protein [Actinomadura fulvescens]